MVELARVVGEGRLLLEVLGEVRPGAWRLLHGLSRDVPVELRTDDLDTSYDLLDDVLALILVRVLLLILSRLIGFWLITTVIRDVLLLFLGLRLSHFSS